MITAEMMRETLGLGAEDGDQDTLIESLITRADAYARTYCRLRAQEFVPPHLIMQMVEEDFGRIGSGGVSSRTLSGASEYYRPHYSEGILAQLRGLRHPAILRRERVC